MKSNVEKGGENIFPTFFPLCLLFCCKELKNGNMLSMKCFLLGRENLYIKNSYTEIFYSSQIIFENTTPKIFFSEWGYYNLHAQEKNDTCKNKINLFPQGPYSLH